nr:trimeric intracellular cation channel family protein [Auraticoccus cholistanensis]
MLLVLDLAGIFVFSLSGGLAGVRNRLDVFGVLVLAALTGLGGGILRDLLIGAVPPASLADWRYLVVPVVAGLVAFRFHPRLSRIERHIARFDALGLGLFCVTGAVKALQFGLNPFAAALLGMLTGVGGGVLRDLMAGRTPLVLREEIYALAALAGASVAVVAWAGGWYAPWVAVLAAAVCIVIRLLALHHHWQMPHAGNLD